MSTPGFHIIRLALTGSEVEDAEVRFGNGLNVVTGPSDTGKTFILQCIDYMCGAGSRPPAIPEASRYDAIEMRIKARRDNQEMTLRRSLSGGAFRLSAEGQEDRILGPQHQGDNVNTLSYFLLELTGLAGKKVRKNQRGETRTLSFRDLAHLAIISEEAVIRSSSPVLTGQYVNKTVEKSVFRLLLSGQDDSSVVAVDDSRVSEARIDAKIELLQQLIEQAQRECEELGLDASLAELQNQLSRIEAIYQQATGELSQAEMSVGEVEQSRRDTWKQLRQVESRLDVLAGLGQRFDLLNQQYISDLHRLEAISEAGIRLGQLNEERCPVCGAPAEHHDEEHQGSAEDLVTVAVACAREAQRVRTLIEDLSITQRDVAAETEELQEIRLQRQTALDTLRMEINERLRPRMQALLQGVRQSQEQRELIHHKVELLKRLDELRNIVDTLAGEQAGSPTSATNQDVPTADVEQFCREVEHRLQAWQFPDVGRVTFDSTTWDVIIGGRPRTSHGKGVRAVTHAAFSMSILSHCIRRQLPHPGIVIIDSPLVVYREPDVDEAGFTQDVKGQFFRDVAASFAESQIIVLENEAVPDALMTEFGATVIRFTGTNVGRWGFLARD